ncbi:MAG: acyl carrier protein [Actinomycetota bacterium]|jgi:acyl carrier protein|nr:acyl carrier protein [Actinomycetota bacterium]
MTDGMTDATTDIELHLRKVAAAHLDVDPGRLLPGARLGDDLCVDSLDAVELTMVLEDEFDIALPDRLVADVRTYGDIVALVRQQVEARHSGTRS